MNDFLKLRSDIIKLYKTNETVVEIALKVVCGFLVFLMATSFMPDGIFSFKRLIILLLGAIISSVASPAVFLIMAGLVFSASVFLASFEAGMVIFIFCILLYLFYIRIFPKESLFLVAMLLLYKIGLPYVVPIVAGLYVGPAAIVPVCVATFMHNNIGMIDEIIQAYPLADFNISGIMDSFVGTCQMVYEYVLISPGRMSIIVIVAIAMIFSWAVSSSFINMEKEKAVLVSGIIFIVGGILSVIFTPAYIGHFGIIGMIISVIASCAVTYIMTFFECVKDYDRTERVVFEDDNYVYYVKAVPKIGEVKNNEQTDKETQMSFKNLRKEKIKHSDK